MLTEGRPDRVTVRMIARCYEGNAVALRKVKPEALENSVACWMTLTGMLNEVLAKTQRRWGTTEGMLKCRVEI